MGERNKLVLKGERGKGKAFGKYTMLGIFIAAMGLLMTILGFAGGDAFGRNSEIVSMGLSVFGGVMLILGIATPFLGAREANNCYIDVYEGYVAGAYRSIQSGQTTKYIAFQLTYDKITGVACKNNKVVLQTHSGSMECLANNAEQITRAIRERLK